MVDNTMSYSNGNMDMLDMLTLISFIMQKQNIDKDEEFSIYIRQQIDLIENQLNYIVKQNDEIIKQDKEIILQNEEILRKLGER